MTSSDAEHIKTAWAKFTGCEAGTAELDFLLSNSRLRSVEAGSLMIEQGGEARSIYLVLTGALKVVWFTKNGHEIWLSELSEGSIVGEISALNDEPRSSSVVAKTDTVLVEISIENFRAAMNASIQLTQAVARALASRVRATSQQVVGLVGLPLAARVHAELQRIGKVDKDDSERLIVRTPPSVSQLAEQVHASREATSRALSTLQKRGLILREKNAMQVIVPDYA